MENQNPYTVHSGDEFNGDERYSVLRGPEEWACWLTEPEDRSWVRDGKEVVDKLNDYHRENAQLKAELAQAKLSYDGAVAAHHEAKSQYRDLIEAHRRELAGWEAAHVALDRELGESKAREERLREALRALHALVKGECPSLLREDSGGDAVLDCAIEAVLKEGATMKSCRECVHGGNEIPGVPSKVYCFFPLPPWVKRVASSLVTIDIADYCSTYHPREERETQP